MRTHKEFIDHLRELLLLNSDRLLLRIVCAPDFECPTELSGRMILDRSERLVSSLGIEQGRSVVLLLLPHSPELFLLHLGLVLAGHIPAILPWPTSRIDPEKYQRNLVHQFGNLPADLLVTLPRLAENLAGSLPYRIVSVGLANQAHYEKLFPSLAVTERLERQGFASQSILPAEDTLFLQFSGGTTGAQKAIVVTSGMLNEQLEILRDVLEFTADDGVVSWLPLYHDMGLIACLWLPLWHGAPSVQIGANDWVIHPELLLKFASRYRTSFCWLPNFAFAYLSQRRAKMTDKYRLEHMRGWINCSEPVRSRSMMQFADSFADCGVTPRTLLTSYAMAETTFAITQSELGRRPVTVPRSHAHCGSRFYSDLAYGLIDDVYTSSGKPLRNTEIRIMGSDGCPCEDPVPGEIHVRTPSLFTGYWGRDGFQKNSLHGGWHATGDFGFVIDEELFVIGRYKDIAIIGGQNVFPEDVEAIVNTLDNVYPGRVVAFGVDDSQNGTQSLAVIAEIRREHDEKAASELEEAIRSLVLSTIGIASRYVAVVPQRWIVKSTAGKISRRETREKFLNERLNATTIEVTCAS